MSVQVWKAAGEPPVDRAEILRYAGGNATHADTVALMESCLSEMEGQWQSTVCFTELSVKTDGDKCDFGAFCATSASLAAMLGGGSEAVLMAATVGIGLDRKIQKYSRVCPSRAMMLQAIGAERIEALCDAFCAQYAASKGAAFMRRFSPGYGDLSLESQRDVFRALDGARPLGIGLTDSLMMVPSKSVTAIAVCIDKAEPCHKNRCCSCDKRDCAFRGDL